MKSFLFLIMLIVGIAACETPQPATGSSEDSTSMQSTPGVSAPTTGTTMDTTRSATDTSMMKRDSTRRDSLP